MENLRNNEANSDIGTDTEPDDLVCEDEREAVEPPPAIGQDERRMHVRAYNFWAGLLGDRQFPSVEDLNPETDDDFGPNSVLLDFTNGVENPTIQFLGQLLREECDIDATITSIDDVPARSLLSRITDHYLQIIANQAPIGFEAEFVNQRGTTIMYRGILLPFSTDDDNIDFIYGVINWKEMAADAVIEQIENEVAEAMRSAPEKIEAGPVWADGPSSHAIEDDSLVVSSLLEQADNENQLADDDSLADWLWAARNTAENATQCEQRSRVALYAAIGQAYDFYLMTLTHPEDYKMLLDDAGLKAQSRAPMTPIVKLVFGAHYDKTRLTEYASALRFAEQAGIAKGAFATFLENHDGGLKAVVHAERNMRNPQAASHNNVADNDAILQRLRAAPSCQLTDIDAGDAEFVVLVARRDADGQLAIVGPVLGDDKLTSRALKQTRI